MLNEDDLFELVEQIYNPNEPIKTYIMHSMPSNIMLEIDIRGVIFESPNQYLLLPIVKKYLYEHATQKPATHYIINMYLYNKLLKEYDGTNIAYLQRIKSVYNDFITQYFTQYFMEVNFKYVDYEQTSMPLK
jgi:hypothetical protein